MSIFSDPTLPVRPPKGFTWKLGESQVPGSVGVLRLYDIDGRQVDYNSVRNVKSIRSVSAGMVRIQEAKIAKQLKIENVKAKINGTA